MQKIANWVNENRLTASVIGAGTLIFLCIFAYLLMGPAAAIATALIGAISKAFVPQQQVLSSEVTQQNPSSTALDPSKSKEVSVSNPQFRRSLDALLQTRSANHTAKPSIASTAKFSPTHATKLSTSRHSQFPIAAPVVNAESSSAAYFETLKNKASLAKARHVRPPTRKPMS